MGGGKCSCKGFCPVTLGLALGITCGLSLMLLAWAAWLWGYGMPKVDEYSAMLPGFAATLGGGLIGFLWGLLKGFIFGVVIGLIYNLILCCCNKGCCVKKEGCCQKGSGGCGCNCKCCSGNSSPMNQSTIR